MMSLGLVILILWLIIGLLFMFIAWQSQIIKKLRAELNHPKNLSE